MKIKARNTGITDPDIENDSLIVEKAQRSLTINRDQVKWQSSSSLVEDLKFPKTVFKTSDKHLTFNIEEVS